MAGSQCLAPGRAHCHPRTERDIRAWRGASTAQGHHPRRPWLTFAADIHKLRPPLTHCRPVPRRVVPQGDNPEGDEWHCVFLKREIILFSGRTSLSLVTAGKAALKIRVFGTDALRGVRSVPRGITPEAFRATVAGSGNGGGNAGLCDAVQRLGATSALGRLLVRVWVENMRASTWQGAVRPCGGDPRSELPLGGALGCHFPIP